MDAWRLFLQSLNIKLGHKAVDQWLKPLKISGFDARNLYLKASNAFQVEWFQEHVEPYLKEFVNNNQQPIHIHLALENSSEGSVRRDAAHTPFTLRFDAWDPEMTIDSLVKDKTDTIAYTLLEQLGPVIYNPVFMYGPPRSGKTHWLTAAAWALKARGKKTLFVKAETYASHIVQAIRLSAMPTVRQTYRDIDVLIVDDIDVLGKKWATQEEFFHTFNLLHTAGKQIILSSKTAPSDLTDIESRLISRFDWGLSIKLTPIPSDALLDHLAARRGVTINEAVKKLILEKCPQEPVMALEALLMRSKTASSIGVYETERLLKDVFQKEEQKAVTPERVIYAIANHFGVLPADLLGTSRQKQYVFPRQIAMAICRKQLGLPYKKIGEIFNRDHTTVMESVSLIESRMKENNVAAAMAAATVHH
ncbi:MAG: Chromosomal replication initiator protein dnaA [Chlamydiota bacterium]|jgi:chromosomal replication initiator protein